VSSDIPLTDRMPSAFLTKAGGLAEVVMG